MGFVKDRVEQYCLLERRDGARQAPRAARYEGQLVMNVRRLIVEADVGLVALRCICVALKLAVDVAELLQRARRGRVELGGGPEVAEGGRQRFWRISAALMGLAALQVGDTIRGSAIAPLRFDGDERLAAGRASSPWAMSRR
jgi:hypothetical protein